MTAAKPEIRQVEALVIGAGPAGLMAAEQLSSAGAQVLVADAKPSVARKLLMAGKSGLNLTFDGDLDAVLSTYGSAREHLEPMIQEFDAKAVRAWAEELGQETFVGSSGRVFPKTMKASPLLRAWLARLAAQKVEFATRWRWVGWSPEGYAQFETPDGSQNVIAKTTVLALGGASWARLGSDGQWVAALEDAGVTVAPFQPANVGLSVDWSSHMEPLFGRPVKGTALHAGNMVSRGEYIISSKGLEGGGVYSIFVSVRDGAELHADLLPDLSLEAIAKRLAGAKRKDSRTNQLRKALKLDKVKLALLQEFARPLPKDVEMPALLKALPIAHAGPRPMDEAISTAGGVAWSAVDRGLMLKARPGVFVAGEMLDWEAPTGGYLLTACFATGRWAGDAARRYLSGPQGAS